MPNVANTYQASIPIIQLLSTNGDGTGTSNAVGDYSAAPTNFYIQPPVGHIYVISELIFHCSDHGTYTIDGYGASTALTNGIAGIVYQGATAIFNLFGGRLIQTNDDYLHVSANYQLVTFASNYQSQIVSYNANSFGTVLRLNGSLNQKLQLELHDDFTFLDDQYFLAHGYY